MSTYTIGEIAVRSGFSASALRYYEAVGLVAPATRSEAGYRIYDDHSLARLAFIARAKQLGCSLQEITDLVGIWDGERCGPVQRRFHELVTAKIADARRQVTELAALVTQLQTAATRMSGPAIDGPCGDECACLADPDDAPIACTLEAGALPARLAEWQAILDLAASRSTAADGALRVEFDDAIDLGKLTRLVAAEQRCCAFFSFAITVDHRGTALEVRAPDGATDVVTSLFGQPG